MKKLSIIVPIYNVEKYIVECLESIITQWDDRIQVICIDDGSTDSSYSKLCEYIAKLELEVQNSFIIKQQKNKGLSATRNKGVEISIGEYIAFLDSDDKLNSSFISNILEVISNDQQPDIIEFNIEYSNGNNILICTNSSSLIDKFKTGNWYACGRVYKRNMLDNKFKVGLNYEDMLLIPQLYLKADKIHEIDKALYWYRYNSSGITHSINENNIKNSIKSFQIIIDTYKNINMNETLRSIILIHLLYISTTYILRMRTFKEAIHFSNKNFVGVKYYLMSNISLKLFMFVYLRRFYLIVYGKYKGVLK